MFVSYAKVHNGPQGMRRSFTHIRVQSGTKASIWCVTGRVQYPLPGGGGVECPTESPPDRTPKKTGFEKV